ncbi:hypothetical protein BB558_000402 [Smittium angustum]|uniref:N-acyl-aliphatic-L-amino acid amidohydrolase n=1 Tax=Smittium angustum TaxID=133377 RepID=A0A2U1JEA9_SMIAN|nr:hypothetical protein BB558_000402 [Smittium angustum]
MEPASVARFREYLKIETVHPNPDYVNCTKFLERQAKEIGLEYNVVECVPGKPTVIMTWRGTDPNLKSILLNSHTDVVPVFEEFWEYPPFSAERVPTDDGDFKIYARGTQDMKVVGSCYLEAIRNLKAAGKTLTRDVHLTFVPDEEIGGTDGMKMFLETEFFKNMNIGFALDEGMPNPGPELYAFHVERLRNPVRFTTHGTTGHGSQFIKDTAIAKLMDIGNELLAYRDVQEAKLISQYGEIGQHNLGEVTTVNMTMVNGGVQANVVPENFTAVFDIRVTPSQNIPEFNDWLKSLAAKHNADFENLSEVNDSGALDISSDTKYWNVVLDVVQSRGLKVINAIYPAATDSRYLRMAGIPAIGISLLKNIPFLLHVHNEYVTESLFLEGIDFYTELIPKLSQV